MALGNIKVDRTAVIAKVEAAITKGEAIVKDGEKAQAALDTKVEKAQAEVTKQAQKIVASGVPQVDVRSWYRRVTINVEVGEADSATLIAAENAVSEARNEADNNKHAVRVARDAVKDGKRDLALLNASSEVTINVKTAGFLGYFE